MFSRGAVVALLAALLWFPLVGAALAHRPLEQFFRFPPPLEIPRDYPRWSWLACTGVLAPFAALAFLWLCSRARGNAAPTAAASVTPSARRRGFPAWGWAALAWTAAWWIFAWTRFPWFAPLQRYTFFPLWLGFIVSVNALTAATSGTCLLQRAPRSWAKLFAASALFWWVFEWLNRFVHNWHYLGVADFGPVGYALHATVCFSTVLPAVAAVGEWLGTRASLQSRLARGPAWPWFEGKPTGCVLVGIGAAGLVLTGARPLQFYPMLWSAPLALLLGAGMLVRRSGAWSEIAAGDWRRTGTWALAALACGFFWELWNFRSAAKWIYTVPFVDAAHVFEMPLLGYLGYLPFGVECLVVVTALQSHDTGVGDPAASRSSAQSA